MSIEELKVRILTEERMLIHRKVLPVHPIPTPQHPSQMQMPPHTTSVYSALEEKVKRCSGCCFRNHLESECWHKHPDKAPPWWKSGRSRPPRTPRDTNQDNKRKKNSAAQHQDSSSSENSEDYKRRKKQKKKDKEKRSKEKHDSKKKKKKDKQKALMILETPATRTNR